MPQKQGDDMNMHAPNGLSEKTYEIAKTLQEEGKTVGPYPATGPAVCHVALNRDELGMVMSTVQKEDLTFFIGFL